jgi:hypothetical protein
MTGKRAFLNAFVLRKKLAIVWQDVSHNHRASGIFVPNTDDSHGRFQQDWLGGVSGGEETRDTHRGPSKRRENQVDGENRVGIVSDSLFSLLPPVHQRVSRFSNQNLEGIVDPFLRYKSSHPTTIMAMTDTEW